MRTFKRKRGSLTVEAVIAFTVFISFMFLLLSMVKIALVKVTLNNAVSETAKTIAACSYPIGMFNDIKEDANESVETKFAENKILKDVDSKGLSALFENIFSDGSGIPTININSNDLSGVVSTLQSSKEDIVKSVAYYGAERLLTKASSDVVASMISGIIDNSYVSLNKENLTLKLSKLPVSKATYQKICKSSAFTDMGLSDTDFNEDDVVIGVEYVYKVTFPLLGSIDMVMREVAVEHAWVNGGSANIPESSEGISLSGTLDVVFGNENVYVTKTGKKYHKKDCFYLWGGSSEIKKSSAISSGYIPCVKCCP